MKIFQTLAKLFENVGISVRQAFGENLLNKKNVIVFCLLIVFSTLTTAFFLFEAKTFREYAESFYISVSMIMISVCFALFIWKTVKIFELIVTIETIIQHRK